MAALADRNNAVSGFRHTLQQTSCGERGLRRRCIERIDEAGADCRVDRRCHKRETERRHCEAEEDHDLSASSAVPGAKRFAPGCGVGGLWRSG
jgi:hypothetical protein